MIIPGGVTATDAITTTVGVAIWGLLLLQEPEEKWVQTALEASWIHIDDARSTSWANSLATLKEVSNDFSHCLDLLFGHELDSPRAFSASICLSILVTGSIGILHRCKCGECTTVMRIAVRWFFVFTAIPALVVNAKRNDGTATVLWVAMLSVCLLAMRSTAAPMTLLIFPLSYLIDVAVIRYERKLFRMSVDATSIWHVVRLLSVSAIVVIGVFVVPVVTAHWMVRLSRAFEDGRWAAVAQPLVIIGTMNVSTVMLPAVFVAFASLLLIKRAAWSLVERPVYTLQRIRIFDYREKLGLAGFALVSVPLCRVLLTQIVRLVR
jgi:hypothetical protein